MPRPTEHRLLPLWLCRDALGPPRRLPPSSRRCRKQCDGWRRHALCRAPVAQLLGHCSHRRACRGLLPPPPPRHPPPPRPPLPPRWYRRRPLGWHRRLAAAARGCDLLPGPRPQRRLSLLDYARREPRSRPLQICNARPRHALPAPLRILPRQAARQLLPAAAAANDAAALAARLRIHHPGQSPVRRLHRLRCRRIRRLLRQPRAPSAFSRSSCPARSTPPPHSPPAAPRSPPAAPAAPAAPLTSVPDGAWTFDLSDASLSAWLGTLRWQPLRLVLQHTLLQAAACFADRRFEVRRMAEQVLGPLVEVALWAGLQCSCSCGPSFPSSTRYHVGFDLHLLLALQRCSAL